MTLGVPCVLELLKQVGFVVLHLPYKFSLSFTQHVALTQGLLHFYLPLSLL